MLVDGATSGKFDVIPVKIKSGGSGYEFDASKKTEVALDVATDKLDESIGRDPTVKPGASNSDASAAKAAAKTALTPSVAITAFSDSRHSTAVADGATSKDGKLYLKFTLSDSSTNFVVGDIAVSGGALSGFTGSRTEYEAVFTPTGTSKVDTKINVAKDKFTNDYYGNTAATEFNWTFDPNNGLEDGDIVKETDRSGNPTGKLLMLDIESKDNPIKYTLVPVEKDSGGNWVYESGNASSKVYGISGLSDTQFIEKIGSTPTGTGDNISDSVALSILKAAGVMVSIHGDEKGGSKAFTAGTYDASDSLQTIDSDGVGWVLKGVKSFGETSTAKGERGIDMDYFALTNSPSSPKLASGQKYKITVADETWNGSDTGNIQQVSVLTQNGRDVELTQGGSTSSSGVAAGAAEFTADGNSYYFLEIMGKDGEDAQYSVFLDVV